MNSMRKIVVFSMALMLAAFTLPSAADNGKKLYSLNMSVPPGQTTAPFTVKATIKNEGNSSIHSFNLFVTGVTVVGVTRQEDATIAFTGSIVTVTKVDDLESGDSRTFTIKVNSCGDGQWSASVWTGAKLNGQPFNLVPAHSNLTSSIPCGPPPPAGAAFTVPDSLNTNCVTGQRGYYDMDGSVPVEVPIYVTNTVPTNGHLHFRWPDFQTGGDPLAAFEYTICATGAAPPVSSMQVAWLNDNGHPASEPGNPAYITAQDCLDPDILPAPYGTLTTTLGLADDTIAIDTTTPAPASPHGSIPYPGSPPLNPGTPGTAFDIVIGPEAGSVRAERITVQLVCLDVDHDPTDSDDCSDLPLEGKALKVVQRGVGGTTPVTHPIGALIMSTPLPLLPTEGVGYPYTPGSQALMCVAARTPVGTNHTTTFIDIGGDGHLVGP